MQTVTLKEFWFWAMLAWAISLTVGGCERAPDPNHYTVTDKWDDTSTVAYEGFDSDGSYRRHHLDVDTETFVRVRIGDRLIIERKSGKIAIHRPTVEAQ
jgi:hypothetical protein